MCFDFTMMCVFLILFLCLSSKIINMHQYLTLKAMSGSKLNLVGTLKG